MAQHLYPGKRPLKLFLLRLEDDLSSTIELPNILETLTAPVSTRFSILIDCRFRSLRS